MTEDLYLQRIALFGGSFDPPHVAHKDIPIFLLKHGYADQVWYVPVKHHPFGKTVSSDDCRVEMLQLTIERLKKEHPEFSSQMRVVEWELEQAQMSYTFKTLQNLSKKNPKTSFRWVIGSDNLYKFDQWRDYQKILNEFGVIVYPRAGYSTEPLQKGMELLKEAPEVTVSSTQIRELTAKGKNLNGFVTSEIAKFIDEHNLYRSSLLKQDAVI